MKITAAICSRPLTFGRPLRTLPIVIYSQVRMLISLLIVLALALAFLWGGSRVLNSVTGAAPPAPTATPRPVIEQPVLVPATHRAGPQRARVAHKQPKVVRVRPSHKPAAPRPTPTPHAPPSVFMTADASTASPQTVFHLGLDRLYCWVRNSALPSTAVTITFNWAKDQPNGFLYQFALARQPYAYTGAYYYVPQVAGKYRCDIIINGQTFGSAHFRLVP
jgi:hypothetical protein